MQMANDGPVTGGPIENSFPNAIVRICEPRPAETILLNYPEKV
jgi:hypothetical protein